MNLEKDLKKAEALSAIDLVAMQKIYKEINIKSEILEASEILPISTLVVYLHLEKKNLDVNLNIVFVPLPADIFPDVKLMQVYTEFPFAIKVNTRAKITEINRALPLGSFGISEANKIYFRYIQTMGKYEILTEHKSVQQNLLNIILYSFSIHIDSLKD